MKTAAIIITFAIISLLSRTSAVKLQLSLLPSVDALEGGSVTLPCSFSPLTTDLNALFIQWWIVSDKIVDRGSIYDSHFKNTRPKVAEFAGDEVNGDCSLKILNVSRTENLVFRCHVRCHRCNAENTEVEGRVKLNVTAAGRATRAPGVETTPTHGLSSWETGMMIGLGMGVFLGVFLGLVVGFVVIIIIIKKRGRLPRIFYLLDSANGREQAHGDVNVAPLMNGVPLVTNGQHAKDERGPEKCQ